MLTSSDREKITGVLIAHLGLHNADGTPTGRYFSGTNESGLYREWCSEFVSCIYKEAGFPFDNGGFTSSVEKSEYYTFSSDDGDWMLRSAARIIKWFQLKDLYYRRGTKKFRDYTPQAGDYVFISSAENPDREHSGIVLGSSKNNTLFTVEGNNKGRSVNYYLYPDFKENTTEDHDGGIIMGIGRR